MAEKLYTDYDYYKDPTTGKWKFYDSEIGWSTVNNLSEFVKKNGKVVEPPAQMTEAEKAAAEQASLEAADDSGLAAIQTGGSRHVSTLKISLGKYDPPKTNVSDTTALRYPSEPGIDSNSDYVAFEFFKYLPPFGGTQAANKRTGSTNIEGQEATGRYYDYNQAGQYEPVDNYSNILLYMPEDISTGFRSNWGGKAFSNFASEALTGLSAESIMSKIGGTLEASLKSVDRLAPMGGAAAIRKTLSKITGDSLSNDDIFGAVSGSVLNPNVELLYQSTDLRNFQLNFKLVPRDEKETPIINSIVQQFKKCMLPSKTPGKVLGQVSPGIVSGFIGVPNLVKVSFMKGADQHPFLPVFKMCALTQVDVNYTPDGAYATYRDGQPVAMTLTLNFQETKLVFAEDLDQGIR